MEKKKVSGNTLMVKEATMKVTGAKTRSVEQVIKSGATAIFTKANGERTQCGAMVFSEYQTNQLTMDNSLMTKSMAMASINGKMGDNLRAGGITGNNMVQERRPNKMAKHNTASGTMDSQPDGSKNN